MALNFFSKIRTFLHFPTQPNVQADPSGVSEGLKGGEGPVSRVGAAQERPADSGLPGSVHCSAVCSVQCSVKVQ